MADSKLNQSDQYKGWLYKWTNYIKGYQKRWFVLQNGLLSYYRNQAEMSHTCRGTINLANAFIHTEDSCSFVISNGGTQTFHLKASSEVERQKWVTALELAKARAVNMMESDEEEDNQSQPDKNELQNTLRTLGAKLEDLNTCNDLITKHGSTLQRALSELEQLEAGQDMSAKIKAVNERATLFRITSNAMINACHDYLELGQTSGKRWQRMLQYEHEHRLRLEEMVEQLAKQHSSLEKKARKSLRVVLPHLAPSDASGVASVSSEDDDDEFHDAITDQTEEFKVCLPPDKTHRRTASGVSVESLGHNHGEIEDYDSSDTDSESKNEAKVISSKNRIRPSSHESKMRTQTSQKSDAGTSESNAIVKSTRPARKRRTAIPEKPNYSINLWSIMRNSIGKELSKIPMPVNFSEPLSFLQRLTEDFEYAECLHKGAQCEDSFEQLAYVAAFTVSSYANLTSRIGKPFNPLLGETFECDRMDDLGWRSVAEQVSHHPPTCAMYADCKEWQSWQEYTMSSKFRGKYLQIIPLGMAHLVFTKSGNHYSWRKVSTTVHNIIVGKLWVDNHGEMDITNHFNGDNCHLKYSAYSYFSKETPRKVTGVVTDKTGQARYVIQGMWDERIEGARVLHTVEQKGKTVYETGPTKVLWQRRHLTPDLERMYFFSHLAVELNEPEERVAPTDSRLRPDQRLMENGTASDWDEANQTKVQLEEKQRAARRRREQESAEASERGTEYQGWEPCWFKKDIDKYSGNPIHLYKHEYWECKETQDWSRCPDIFL